MIYTFWGVKVEIKAVSSDQRTALVKEIGTDWKRVKPIAELKADGGWPELEAALNACGDEYPAEATTSRDVFLQAVPRNPLTGRYIRHGEGRQ